MSHTHFTKKNVESISLGRQLLVVRAQAVSVITQLHFDQLRLNDINCFLAFSRNFSCNFIAGKKRIVKTKSLSNTFCYRISLNNLQSQPLICDHWQLMRERVENNKGILGHWKYSEINSSRRCFFQFFSNYFVRHREVHEQLISDAEQQAAQISFPVLSVALAGYFGLIPSNCDSGKYSCDRADRLHPCGQVFGRPEYVSEATTCNYKNCKGNQANSYFTFKFHNKSESDWQNRNTSGIGGGK